jgi:hypothetical protein
MKKLSAKISITGDWPRFQKSKSFPFTAVHLIVVFTGNDRDCQLTS